MGRVQLLVLNFIARGIFPLEGDSVFRQKAIVFSAWGAWSLSNAAFNVLEKKKKKLFVGTILKKEEENILISPVRINFYTGRCTEYTEKAV